jgi:hypothetical protein
MSSDNLPSPNSDGDGISDVERNYDMEKKVRTVLSGKDIGGTVFTALCLYCQLDKLGGLL